MKTEIVTLAKINTIRLLQDDAYPYRFIIRETNGGKIVCEYNLVTLLSYTKLVYREGEKPGREHGYLTVGLVVEDWILWFNNVEPET